MLNSRDFFVLCQTLHANPNSSSDMVLCVDPLGLSFSDGLVAMRHLSHTKSSSVTSVQGGLATLTGLCFILLLQLYPWETLPVVIYVHGAFLWLVVLGELTPLMEEGLPCLCPVRNGSLNHLATKLLKNGPWLCKQRAWGVGLERGRSRTGEV